jgi:hypothetical protein
LRLLRPPPLRPTFDIASLLPTFAIDTLVMRSLKEDSVFDLAKRAALVETDDELF